MQVNNLVAGGYPLWQLLPDAKTKDIDVFTTQEPVVVLEAMGLTAAQHSNTVAKSTDEVEVIRFVPPSGQSLLEAVLSSFDFGIIQCGYDPVADKQYVTDLWVEHASEGLIELDPRVDPWRNPVRTQVRASKLLKKLGWQLGPLLTAFIRERARQDFAITKPEEAEVFQVQPESRPVFEFDNPDVLRGFIQHTYGPRHILEVAYGTSR